jgi:hypothetical protein
MISLIEKGIKLHIMKSNIKLSTILFALLIISFSSCIKDSCERVVTYTKLEPVYLTYDEIRNAVIESSASRELSEPGKIYYYNDYLFINERNEGIHIIDNSNAEAPLNIGFISIPGNEDISIKDDFLYANSYMDLLTIDVSDIQDANLINRSENMFPTLWNDIENEQILAYYDEEEVTEELDCDEMTELESIGGFWFGCVNCNFAFEESFVNDLATTATGNGGGGTGTGGSMARFSVIGDYLYSVDQFTLKVFSLDNPTIPTQTSSIDLGWGIETIFPYEDKLFIGSNSGMFIYDNSNPELPTFLSAFQHATACDPVFVKDNFAYVTLRDGNQCQGFSNQLDLIDITDITQPSLVKSFQMDNPHGLSIRDNSLFLCEGDFGLKVFDIDEPTNLGDRKIDQKKDLHAFDVIAIPSQEKILLVIGDDGFYQYNYDDPSNLKLLSKIQVQ